MKPDLPFTRSGADPVPRWNRLADYFHHRYGERVQKIPLDAGFSCPNRDGTLSFSGCIFCNPLGSGTGLGLQGLDLAAQWAARCAGPREKGVRRFLAYLQSFSNTYGPLARLRAVLEELRSLPGITGLAVGTRPDCVDKAKLACIRAVAREQDWDECWIEYGVQSRHDATLYRIRRGHDIACAETAVRLAAGLGVKVCVHLIAGLPGEDEEAFAQSVRWASAMPIQAVKFHCLYVCRETALADLFTRGEYLPWSQERYIKAMIAALPLLRKDIIVQRITGQPGQEELLAPAWAGRVLDVSNRIQAGLAALGTWQGKDVPEGMTSPFPSAGL